MIAPLPAVASTLGPSTGRLSPDKPPQVALPVTPILQQPHLSSSDCLVFQGPTRQREQLRGKDEENGETPVSAFSRACCGGYQGGPGEGPES